MSAIVALTEDELYLMAILSDTSGIDLAEFTWVDDTPGKPDPCYRLWDVQWVMYTNEATYQIDQCFPEGSLVLTNRGHVPIEEVVIGDHVLTHTGQWQPVTHVWDRGDQDLVELRGVGHPAFRVTADHELYVRHFRRRTSFAEPEWIPAVDLEVSAERHHKWATPAYVAPVEQPRIIERYAPGRSNDLTPRHFDLPEFWWLVGLFVAEGSTSSSFGRGGKKNRVSFSVHVSERDKVASALQASGFKFSESVQGNCAILVVNSLTLAAFLIEFAGIGARNKGLHPSVFSNPHRAEVLNGAMFGDGYEREGANYYTTVSRRLAFDMRLLASTLGLASNVTRRRSANQIILGRRVNAIPAYVVTISLEQRRSRMVFDKDHGWGRVLSRSESGRARCYDLEVQQDHSYVVEGIVVHNCARAIGKSQGILMRAYAFPFNFAGQEMLITAPELNHLGPIVDKVEEKFTYTRLGREMLPSQKGGGIKHQPQFQATFINGAKIMGRLPGKTGRGLKGQHSLRLEMDEAQDMPEQAWIEIIETMNSAVPGAQWRAHGVSRGVRDAYYRMTQEDAEIPFFVHRYPAMFRPSWNEKERADRIALYGSSRDNPDYKRNIYGEHGDATNPLFVLARLMACVRHNESTWATEYNSQIYSQIRIEGESMHGRPIESFITMPQSHLSQTYTSYWAGMDIGYTNDPSEILVFGQVRIKEKDVLRLLTRVHMMRIDAPDQEMVIGEVFKFYGERLRCLALDKTGAGLPIWQHMVKDPIYSQIHKRVKGYGFSEKKAVEFDDRPLGLREKPEDAVIEKNVIQYASDKLRDYVDAGMVELPFDRELLTEWQGQTVVYVRDEASQRGSRTRYGGGSFHCVDEETEILTAEGWRGYDEISVNDRVLTLDMESQTSRWSDIDAISIYEGPAKMVLMEARGHSSLTTPNHRWPVRAYNGQSGKFGPLKWKTTETLTQHDGVLTAVPYGDFPSHAVYSDELVELIAWYWTEGNCTKSNTNIKQSRRVHPDYVERIDAALSAEFGPEGHGRNGMWHRYEQGGDVWFMLRMEVGVILRDLAPERIPRSEFLLALTAEQLQMFIEVSEMGDGNHAPGSTRRAFQHLRDERQNRMLEMACVLAGIKTTTAIYPREKSRSGVSVTTHLGKPLDGEPRTVRPGKFRESVPYSGIVWCPTTRDGNWLARRKGTVYWTGNTLDASKLMILGKELEAIEATLARDQRRGPRLDRFGY